MLHYLIEYSPHPVMQSGSGPFPHPSKSPSPARDCSPRTSLVAPLHTASCLLNFLSAFSRTMAKVYVFCVIVFERSSDGARHIRRHNKSSRALHVASPVEAHFFQRVRLWEGAMAGFKQAQCRKNHKQQLTILRAALYA